VSIVSEMLQLADAIAEQRAGITLFPRFGKLLRELLTGAIVVPPAKLISTSVVDGHRVDVHGYTLDDMTDFRSLGVAAEKARARVLVEALVSIDSPEARIALQRYLA
jgi:hypothetical protein